MTDPFYIAIRYAWCIAEDGGVCSGYRLSLFVDNDDDGASVATNHGPLCGGVEHLPCPDGTVCQAGAFFSRCCNRTAEGV